MIMFILLGLIGFALFIGWVIAMSDLRESKARKEYAEKLRLSKRFSNSLTDDIS